jgi:hypothetical protein
MKGTSEPVTSTSPFNIIDRPGVRTGFTGFPNASELELRLREAVRGEVRFDAGTRALYATDASNYRQAPIGVVTPADAADVEAAMAVCREFGAPVLSRGAATSLAGQCCNTAVILDFSRSMNRIVSIDPAGRPSRPIQRRTTAARWAA